MQHYGVWALFINFQMWLCVTLFYYLEEAVDVLWSEGGPGGSWILKP